MQENMETEGDKEVKDNIQKYEARECEPVTGSCNSCFCLEKLDLPLPTRHGFLLTCLAEPQLAHLLVLRRQGRVYFQ